MRVNDYLNNRNLLDMVTEAAKSYYVDNQTQAQISQKLGVSGSTVSRLLDKARAEGIVRITIIDPRGRQTELEKSIKKKYSLKEAIIVCVPSNLPDSESAFDVIGKAAAPCIDDLIKPGMQVGVGGGRSVAALVKSLKPFSTSRYLTTIQVMGEYDAQQSTNRGAELTRLLAEMYSGTSYFFNAPALVEDPAVAEVLLHTPGVIQLQSFFNRLDMILVGVGQLHGSPLEKNGLLKTDQMKKLIGAQAVGDICGHFLDVTGKLVDDLYPGKIIAINWEQICRCPSIVVFAFGDEKIPILKVLLNEGHIHVLITDENTARKTLD